ncbi:MarR family winged helix-turn-helix transcriptional regulator [Microbacterium sp. ASV49]|uniref:MarR family transcriptional regulator n=1 Tax=Microbacterium candidum TaxID=3041922 RepID=A0ABT7MX21_9MICO|nr:MarR family transcriptional regulator [Microbacterium sp. ASV49]MDL9979001.1 MarR family transcriptional regulator [Microbacterium sp. ASV49]
MVHGLDQEDNGPLIGALLRRPFLASRAAIVDALHGAGFDDLQPAHLAVFQHPGPDGRSPGDIARSAMTTKQAMNNLLGQLEGGGYLRRTVSPANRRERVVELTDRGRRVIAEIRRAVEMTEGEWSDALGAGEYARLRRLLAELNEHLE